MQSSPFWHRLLAAAAYLLPWSDAIPFGRTLFGLFPPLQLLSLPSLPIAVLEQALPFGSLVVFLGLFLGVVRNQRVPYGIRFNVFQAILLDIVLVLLSLVLGLLTALPASAAFALRTLNHTVFLGTLLVVGFCMVQALRGVEPDLPTVSEAVRMQL